ncbi:TetR/AcrR family transcriptional regulator [Cellulophaga sp. L1A9]|uniref:TetR/AcrR family transcriptional regulator n=1 Tax=Cellulophaga sp. L1A9 TaxID=2686362 RepID=UPI00131C7216|nr:TetR family transcriptional regulator [Cellulophaga sp. L1A9]
MKEFKGRKLEIVKTASSLFNTMGYKNVTMRVLAEEIGIKAASLYNHISSKQEILSAIIISLAEQFTNSMDTVMADDSTPVEKIKSIIIHHIEITLNNPDGTASLQNDWMYLEGDDLIYFKKMRKQYEENFRQIIKSGIASGEIRKIDSETMLFSILTTLRSLYIWYSRQKEMDKDKLKADMISVLLDGIRT